MISMNTVQRNKTCFQLNIKVYEKERYLEKARFKRKETAQVMICSKYGSSIHDDYVTNKIKKSKQYHHNSL